MTAALEGGEWSAARPGRTLPPGKTRYSLYRRLGGPQGRSRRAENLVPTGIRSRTAQPVAQSLYRLSYPAHHIYIYIRTCMRNDSEGERSEVRVTETETEIGCGIFPGVDIRWSSWRVVGLKEELGPLVSIFTAWSHERVTDSPIK